MPGCVLRVSGNHFDPREFLDGSSFIACNVFRNGEPKSQDRVWTTSGFTIVVSQASGDELKAQIQAAIEFLRIHKEELVRLIEFEGVDEVHLDFGVNRKDGFVQSHHLPPELLSLAGALGIGIEISIYATDESI